MPDLTGIALPAHHDATSAPGCYGRLRGAKDDLGRNPRPCAVSNGLAAGGRWSRTCGTAAQKPWISAAFRALRGYRRGSQTIPPDGSAFLLLRLDPLHR